MNEKRYRSRKFWLSASGLGAGIVALFLGKMDGPTYVALVSFILGIYGTANVAEKKKISAEV